MTRVQDTPATSWPPAGAQDCETRAVMRHGGQELTFGNGSAMSLDHQISRLAGLQNHDPKALDGLEVGIRGHSSLGGTPLRGQAAFDALLGLRDEMQREQQSGREPLYGCNDQSHLPGRNSVTAQLAPPAPGRRVGVFT
ncbi:MAG TPA: hypothetical protein VLC93_06635 [Myxococcota bacterium]|nr:hypothetical protein [Myxococcota bacterium]